MHVSESDLPDVQALGLFEGVSTSAQQGLLTGATCQVFPAHLELVVAGDRPDFLYVVMEGSVELYCANKGRESIVGLVEPGQALMLAAMVSGERFLMSARTTQRCRILTLQAARFREIFNADTAFATAVALELARAYRAVATDYRDLRLRNATERLANHLLVLSTQSIETEEFDLPYDKRILAGLLAMTPENLSRAFARLKRYGVHIKGTRVFLSDPPALQSFAGIDPLPKDDCPKSPHV